MRSASFLVSGLVALAVAGVVSACSSSNGNSSDSDPGTEADGSPGGVAEGGAEASTTAEGGAEASTTAEGGACTTVNVYNFDNWCTVNVNGAATSDAGPDSGELVAAPYSSCVTTGTSVHVTVAPASSTFELGPNPFVYASPDNYGSEVETGDGGNATAILAVTIDAPACILVCCPFTNGTGCDSSESGYSAFLAHCGQ
jgi:hypothetical protein